MAPHSLLSPIDNDHTRIFESKWTAKFRKNRAEGNFRSDTSYGNKVRKDAVSDAVISQLDLLPTILELAKHPLANELATLLDGKSLVPLLRDMDSSWPDRELFWHYPGYRISNPQTMTGTRPESAMRSGDWKMIESLETGSVQLYDLATNIGESNDVSAANPEVVEQLRQRLHQWRVETNAPMLEHKGDNSMPMPRADASVEHHEPHLIRDSK